MSIRTEDLYSPLIAVNAISPRSALVTPRLYAQDTKKPESITSFIQRTARLYEISNNDVIDGYILPKTNLNYGRRFLHARKGAYSIDGAGIYAEEFATGLSKLMPSESQAYYSSFMFLRSLLGWRYRGLSAGKLKWCPLCWREQENNGEDIRGLLSWTVDINTACSKHKIDLVTRCPVCDRENPVISAGSELGICIHCGSSLYKDDVDISSSRSSEAMWVAQAIDDLIASRKELSSIDLVQRWRHFIARTVDQYSSEKKRKESSVSPLPYFGGGDQEIAPIFLS